MNITDHSISTFLTSLPLSVTKGLKSDKCVVLDNNCAIWGKKRVVIPVYFYPPLFIAAEKILAPAIIYTGIILAAKGSHN